MNRKFLALLLAFLPTFLPAQQKFALVIGNSAYSNVTKLANPVNDANDMAALLEQLGFNVEKILNGRLDQMEDAALRLKTRLSVSKDSYGFLFYAGHGVQSNGDNYLLPVDANIPSETFLRQRAFSVQTMLDELNNAGNALNIVVLDACRDNPFSWKRSGSRGLSVVGYQPADSIIVYATSAGSTAADGTGRNGLFTGHLLNNMRTPGLEITEVLRRTMADVSRDSSNTQRPAVYNQFSGLAYLGGPPIVGSQPTAIAQAVQPEPAAVVVPAPQPAPAKPVPVPKEPQKTKAVDPNNAKLWTLGASFGTAFVRSRMIGTMHGTLAPSKYSFFDLGLDIGGGTIHNGWYSVKHFSVYPFANYAFFAPFKKQGGWYVGAGCGMMFGKYTFDPEGTIWENRFIVNVVSGFNLFDIFDISYTLRTDFKSLDNKVSVGYVYRFK